MHLKRLEAYGFKSFADRLVLNFTDGVTCIVGPNGCGKSNISDAIRWVLGEQNAQDLRTGKGRKMDQVIFKGTTNRKPMAYCEVTLTFDNKDRTLLVDSDEVSVMRKMYRTGESEYYINNQRDKLKNLINLFRDTGIGKDGYSIIGQGKIDTFLTAKPEDRRQIFEEAAGITKYKANRKEATRSLEKTQVNLDLVTERLRSLESRMEPLKKQAIIAEKANNFKQRIKILDVNHFLYITEHSEEQKRALTEKLVKANSQLEHANNEQTRINSEYDAVIAEINNADVDIKVLYQRIVELTRATASKDSEQQKLIFQLNSAEELITEKQQEIEEKRKVVEANAVLRTNYMGENQTVTLALMKAKAEEEEIVKEYERLDAALTEMRNKVEITRNLLINSVKQLGNMTGDVVKLETERINLENNVEKTNNVLAVKNHELGEVKRKLTGEESAIVKLEEERGEKLKSSKDLRAQLVTRQNSLGELDDRLAEIKDTITQKKLFIQIQEANKANYASYDAAVKFLMTCSDPGVKSRICGVIGDLINVSPKYALAIETALGNNVNNIITKNQEDTSYLIEYLKRFSGGRGTFLPLTNMRPRPLESVFEDALEEDGCVGLAADLVKIDREYRSAIEILLGRVIVVDTMNTAIRMVNKYKNMFRIVTLTGENYAVSGAVTGGRTKAQSNHTLSVEAVIAEYKKAIEGLEKSRQTLLEERETIDKEMKEIGKTSSILESILNKLDKDISAAEQRKQYVLLEKLKLENEIEELKKSVEADKNEILAKKMIIENEKKKIDNQDSEQSGTDDLIAQMKKEEESLETQRNAQNEKRTAIISTIKNLEMRSKELISSIATLERETDRLNNEILSATATVNIKTGEAERLRKDVERIALENADNEELVALKQRRERLEESKVELNVKQATLYKEMQSSAENVRIATEQKAKAETMLDNLQKEISEATEKVREDYGLDYETAAEFKEESYDDNAGLTEAKSLRRELAKLGEVNEMAISDLADLTVEYDELKLHYDDVVKARDMLNETINDLTKKMESIFKESFGKIKDNFAVVFSELFDGGKGRLDLDIEYGQSILDAGIIIEAEPPGKKLQNIDLLSGGERALTAIAIIFAIIKLNPVPFCILDEVDAPLDDSNSVVYAKFLRKFSKNTQFIIVSHRKPTMELANELYGITMQEKGVSKLLSVKLSEALEIAAKATEGTGAGH